MEDRRLEKNCDIVVVGAGHAGCEAALACARLGLDTVMFTVSVEPERRRKFQRTSGKGTGCTWWGDGQKY